MANEVNIKVTADDLASAKIRGVGKSAESASDKLRSMRGSFLAMGAAGAAITGMLALFTKSSMEQQIGVNLLNNSLKNVGTSYEAQQAQIEGVIGALQDKTNIGDEDQRQSLSSLIALTGDYEISLRALEVVADMATAMQMDFTAASLLVAKALSGQTSSLSRYGISIDSSATKTEVLAALTEKFGGAAEAAANPMTQLGNRTGDLAQAMGEVLLPIMNQLLPTLEKIVKSTVGFMEENKGLTTVLVGLAAVVGPLLIVLGTLGLAIPLMTVAYGGLATAVTVAAGAKALLTTALWANVGAWIALHAATGGLLLVIAAALTAVVAVLVLLVKNWDAVYNAIKKGINFLIGAFEFLVNVHIEAINKIIEGFNHLARVVGQEIDTIANVELPKLGFAITEVADNTEDYFDLTQKGFKETTKVIKEETKKVSAILQGQQDAEMKDAMEWAENKVKASDARYAAEHKKRWDNVADEKQAAAAEREAAKKALEDEEKAAKKSAAIEQKAWDEKKKLFQFQMNFQRDLNNQKLADALDTAAAADAAEKALAENNRAEFERIRAAVMRLPGIIPSGLGLMDGGLSGGGGTAIARNALNSLGAGARMVDGVLMAPNAAMTAQPRGFQGGGEAKLVAITMNVNTLMTQETPQFIASTISDGLQSGAIDINMQET